jgi:hypothetical protein
MQVTTVFPGPINFATSMAAKTLRPLVAPTKNPSSYNKRNVVRTTSESFINSAPSIGESFKLSVSLPCPIPSVIDEPSVLSSFPF